MLHYFILHVLIEESEKYITKCPKYVQSDQNITTKFTNNENSRSNLKEYEDVLLFSQDVSRHHEDSGIDMSPIKKDDNLEDDEFLEKARKVSPIENSPIIGRKVR